jgi:hypothetical protein
MKVLWEFEEELTFAHRLSNGSRLWKSKVVSWFWSISVLVLSPFICERSCFAQRGRSKNKETHQKKWVFFSFEFDFRISNFLRLMSSKISWIDLCMLTSRSQFILNGISSLWLSVLKFMNLDFVWYNFCRIRSLISEGSFQTKTHPSPVSYS